MINELSSKFSASTLLRYQEIYIKLLESIIFKDVFEEKNREIHLETVRKISQGNHEEIFISMLMTSIEMIAEMDQMIQADKIDINVLAKEDFPYPGQPLPSIHLHRKANAFLSKSQNFGRDVLITKYTDPILGQMGNSMYLDSQTEINPATIALLAEKMLYDVAMFRINEIRKKKGVNNQKIADDMEKELLGEKNE